MRLMAIITLIAQVLILVCTVAMTDRVRELEAQAHIQRDINRMSVETIEQLDDAIRDMRSRYFTAPTVDDKVDI